MPVIDSFGPFEHASLQINFGAIDFAEAQNSMRLFASEVMPAFAQDQELRQQLILDIPPALAASASEIRPTNRLHVRKWRATQPGILQLFAVLRGYLYVECGEMGGRRSARRHRRRRDDGRRRGRLADRVYNVAGEIFATDNICTHAFAMLTDGFLDGDVIECPLHGGCFKVKTGEGMGAPISENVKTYPVRMNGETIEINVA